MQLLYVPVVTILGIYFKEMKVYVHTEKLYMDVHRSFIYNSPNLEATHLSMVKESNSGTVIPWNITNLYKGKN